ncbi:MAG: metalloregulator ArsR/SmtB family transcription factor [Ferruginibacter sp.]
MRRDVFQAIADPTRREIINIISNNSLNLNAVAENFNITRPAISKHIKILTECGLIVIKQQGRERICEARLEKLNDVSNWVEQYRKFWTYKLDALENHLDKTPGKNKLKTKKGVPAKNKKSQSKRN